MVDERELEEFRAKSLFPTQRKTPLPGGYVGKILRVDLSQEKVVDEYLPEEAILRKWLGGQGLGQLILMHELPLGISPLSPENVMVIMTGPLTGTGRTPGGANFTVTTYSNIAGGKVTNSNANGFWAPRLKFAGYDGIIITGAAKRPVYLWINDGKAEIRDAGKIWGKDSHETVDLVRQDVGQPNASVATIGPAGENLVAAAMIIMDYRHTAAHGCGAIMGSKKLKAIAVHGTGSVQVKDIPVLTEAGDRWREKLKPQIFHPPSEQAPGGRVNIRHTVGYGFFIGTVNYKNWQSCVFPEATTDFDKQEYPAKTCYACTRLCPHDIKILTGTHKGYVARTNGGTEHMEGVAFTLGVGGPDVHYLVDVINKIGLDACQFGCAAGVAFEAYEKGLITSKDTDGLELKWGDTEVVEKVLWKMATRDGWLGNALADGPKAMAEKIGGEAQKWVVHIKGGAPAMHDWRPCLGAMLGQIISSGGIKPQFAGYDINYGAPDLGYPEITERQVTEGKAKEVFLSGLNHLFCGSSGACWFAQPIGVAGILYDMVDALASTTGWDDFSLPEALSVGERTWQLEHILHIRYGWAPDDDIKDVGPRFLEPLPDGPVKGWDPAKVLPDLVREFHQECGWDEKTGRPHLATLKRLGMEEFSFICEAPKGGSHG